MKPGATIVKGGVVSFSVQIVSVQEAQEDAGAGGNLWILGPFLFHLPSHIAGSPPSLFTA